MTLGADHDERVARARISLEGLSVGDALGGFFEGATRLPHWVTTHTPPAAPWHFTDDTQMALSVVAILQRCRGIDQDQLARSFAEHYQRSRGYGPATRTLLARIRGGGDWRAEASGIFGGQGSYGNGAAMRVAPLGAFFADDLDAVIEHARRSAEITHAHAEGVAGAIATAVAAAWAWQLRGQRPPPTGPAFLDLVLPLIPDSEVRNGISRARDLPAGISAHAAADVLGNGRNITAQDTVPFALWCAGQHLGNFEEAFWLTASGLGDVDTTCAIAGGVVAAYCGVEGIPPGWLDAREPLPAWAFE